MPKTTTDARFSIDNQLLARLSDLKGARIAYREACLLHAQQPENEDRKHAVAELEAEIKGHELAIERLDAAKLAQSDTSVQEAEAARIKAARDAAKTVAATTPRIKEVLERLVDNFDLNIAPALAELGGLVRERDSASWAATVSALGVEKARRNRAALDLMHAETYLASTLLAAIVRSGIGQVGPRLEPWVSISPPVSGAGTPEQSIEGFHRQAQKLDEFLADAIKQATNPAPITIEE